MAKKIPSFLFSFTVNQVLQAGELFGGEYLSLEARVGIRRQDDGFFLYDPSMEERSLVFGPGGRIRLQVGDQAKFSSYATSAIEGYMGGGAESPFYRVASGIVTGHIEVCEDTRELTLLADYMQCFGWFMPTRDYYFKTPDPIVNLTSSIQRVVATPGSGDLVEVYRGVASLNEELQQLECIDDESIGRCISWDLLTEFEQFLIRSNVQRKEPFLLSIWAPKQEPESASFALAVNPAAPECISYLYDFSDFFAEYYSVIGDSSES